MALSDREREILASNAVEPDRRRAVHPDDVDPAEDDRPPEYPWRDGRGDVTEEMCNALRCAAHDGVAYTKIAEMFDALADRSHARLHATGEKCAHTGVEPVSESRTPGPPGKLSDTDCALMRRRYESGEYDEYTQAGEAFGVSRPIATKHIKGNCRH